MTKRKNISDILGRFDGGYPRDDLDFEHKLAALKPNGRIGATRFGACYETHPPLVLPNGKTVYGGSCGDPVVKDADIYIGFDRSMKRTERAYPWTLGHEFNFPITDMAAPSDPDAFRRLVEWSLCQIEKGAKLHCGCIGGHGRTGTFLCALVAETGEKDALAYVRERYCEKAVETAGQVRFLVEHFGITEARGAKEGRSRELHWFDERPRASIGKKDAPRLATYDPRSPLAIW